MSFPQISYMASCPCLSDRLKFPNFFRTIPSDIYQARAMARLAIRFHWTWIGAVIVNNDYGHLAIQVRCCYNTVYVYKDTQMACSTIHSHMCGTYLLF